MMRPAHTNNRMHNGANRLRDGDFPDGAAALSQALAAKHLSSVDAVTHYLANIERDNPRLRTYIHVTAESALAAALASDARRAQGNTLGALDGVPIALKDNIDLAGVPATGGIEHYRHSVANTDAVVTRRLKAAGAVILGKLNMHEAALGATNDNPWFGRCENPLRAAGGPALTPGGSSGGSAVAVAAGLCAAALGSDTMGSVRVPASYCGVYGFMPSYGRISTRGVMPLSPSLDHVGFLGARAEDLVLLYAAIAAIAADGTARGAESPHARSYTLENLVAQGFPRGVRLRGIRFGVPNLQELALEQAVEQAWRMALNAAQQLGATLVELPLPGLQWQQARREAFLISEVEGAAVFGAALADNPEGFSAPLRKMLAFGARQTPERVAQARACLRDVTATVHQTFNRVDAWILPTTPQRAFAFDAPVPANQADLTCIANIAQLAAVAIPMPAADGGLPASIQIFTRTGQDSLALHLALAFSGQSGVGRAHH